MIIERFKDCYAVRDGDPGLPYLRTIAAAFSHLPYENVTKILKDARATQPAHKLRATEEVLQDHLRWKTGGTCFSLCNALQEILQSAGFDCFIAMADMHYGASIHCAVMVRLNERDYLLDPGYLLHDPIPLPECGMEVVRETAMNTVLLRCESPSVFSLYTNEAGQTKWRYRLHANRISRQEFTEHWIHSFSLNSMEHLMFARMGDTARLYFRKDRLEQVEKDSRRKIIIPNSEIAALSQWFDVPSDLIVCAQKALASSR